MKKGAVYFSGKDYHERPVLILNLTRLNFDDKKGLISFKKCLAYYMLVLRQYCFYPGKVENFIFILDVGGCGITDVPMDLLKSIIEIFSVLFAATNEKAYVLNPS